jgi:hypothetical protein
MVLEGVMGLVAGDYESDVGPVLDTDVVLVVG